MEGHDMQKRTEFLTDPESGLSQDVLNDLTPFAMAYKYQGKGWPAVVVLLKATGWQPAKYEEHFGEAERAMYVTEKAKPAIVLFDKKVEELRERLSQGIDTLTFPEFNAYCRDLAKIVNPGTNWDLATEFPSAAGDARKG